VVEESGPRNRSVWWRRRGAGDGNDADSAADVGYAGDIGVQDGEQAVEVASGAGGDELFGDEALLGGCDSEPCGARGRGGGSS
jgi:hypothetical protein